MRGRERGKEQGYGAADEEQNEKRQVEKPQSVLARREQREREEKEAKRKLGSLSRIVVIKLYRQEQELKA